MLGTFRTNSRTRMEFLELIKRRSGGPSIGDNSTLHLACIEDE
jgi:hypothetical protein